MKTHFITVFALCFFAFTSIFGQKQVMEGVKISWGDIYKTHSEGRKFIGEAGENVYLMNEYYTYKGKIGILAMGPIKYLYSIEKYDKNGNFQVSKDIPKRADRAEVFYEFSLILNGRLLLFTSQFARKQSTLYMQEVDKETLEFLGEKKEIMRTELPKGSTQSNYFHEISPNKKRLAIFNAKLHKDRNIRDLDIEVFDEEMNLIWSRNFDYDIRQTLVDNNGDLYNLVYSKDDDHNWSVRKYTDEGGKLKRYDMDLGEFVPYRIGMALRENKGLVCTGLYTYEKEEEPTAKKKSKKRKVTTLEHSFSGTFYAAIDESSEELVKVKLNEFYAEFLSDFSLKVGSPKQERLAYYYLSDIIVREDGGAVLIAEQYFTVSHTSYSRSSNVAVNSSSTTVTHHSGTILVADIHPSGEMNWIRRVDKMGGASTFGHHLRSSFLGHVKTVKDEVIYLIYNNSDDGYAVFITRILKDGKEDTYTLQKVKGKEEKFGVSTGLSGEVSDSQLWIHTDRGHKSKIGILEFD